MRKAKIIKLLSVVTTSVLSACESQPEPATAIGTAAVDTAAVLAQIDSLRSTYSRAVAEADWPALEGLVSEDALIVEALTPAHDSMRAAASGAPFPSGATLEITPQEVRLLSQDWAYEIGTATFTWTPAGTDIPRTATETYLVILQRTREGWKVHREVASATPLREPGS